MSTDGEPVAERIPAAWRQRLLWGYRLLLLGLGAWGLVWSLRAVWAFTIDDAGISYAYAKHLADGRGPVAAVGGPWVEGYSNPLWVFLLVPVHALGLDVPAAAKWLGAGLFVAALAAGSAFVAQVEGRRGAAFGAVDVGFALAAAICLELVVWVPAGLENALFGALLLGMLYLDARESQRPAAFPGSGLLAFALSITRPEGALYAAPLVLIKLARALRGREPMRQALTTAALFVGPFVLYHAVHYLVFRELVPNTYWAKPPGKDWRRGADYLATALRESGLVYAVPLALLGSYARPRLKLLAVWAALSGVLFVVYAGGDWMPYGRFLSLFAPALLVLAALGLSHLVRGVAWVSRGRVPREAAALVLAAVLGFGWWRYQAPRLAALAGKGWCHFCERLTDTERVRRLGARAGLPSQSLLTQDFGGPSWLSSVAFYPLDFLGLCDRSAALLRRERVSGSVGHDIRLYQYFLHEQPAAPTWLALPRNFWPLFDRSPEYQLDYYPLPARHLPRTRRDAYFALHRGELVDYFPPVPPAAPVPLTDGLTLLGFAVFADDAAGAAGPEQGARLGPGARVRVLVSVVPREGVRGSDQLALRVEAGNERVESEPVRLDRGIDGVAEGLAPGEPLAVEFALTLPSAPAAAHEVSLAIAPGPARARKASVDMASARGISLGELVPGAPLVALERSLPRYPSALPAPLDPELRRLQPSLAGVIERRRHGQVLEDAALARQLISSGERLEASGDSAQAYLAYVWATHARRRAWEELADRVFALRPLALDDTHPLEIRLLQRYYASLTPEDLGRLVAFYLSLGRPLEAGYFARRWPAAEPGGELPPALREALDAELSESPRDEAARHAVLERAASDPLGGALDFETSELHRWRGEVAAFRAVQLPERHGMPGLRGRHGRGVLSSREGGEGARGAIESAEFRIEGRLLSLLVGGGSRRRRVGVELWVDGVPVHRAAGNDSDNLMPVFWDVAPFAGKLAHLRVFDQSRTHHVLVDRVLSWR